MSALVDRIMVWTLATCLAVMTGIVMVRWSDDDCSTFGSYRPMHMAEERPEVRRCGIFTRRTLETRYISGNAQSVAAPRIKALELEISQ